MVPYHSNDKSLTVDQAGWNSEMHLRLQPSDVLELKAVPMLSLFLMMGAIAFHDAYEYHLTIIHNSGRLECLHLQLATYCEHV